MPPKSSCGIISHRGVCRTSPLSSRVGENTIEAFAAGIKKLGELGLPKSIEFDVRLSKDQKVIVIHDETLNRTTNGTGLVRDFTVPDLKKLDAGLGRRIPLLSEVLDCFKEDDVIFNIELKEKNLITQVVKMVEENNLRDKVILSASDEDDNDSSQFPEYYSCWAELFQLKGQIPFALIAYKKKIQSIGADNFVNIAAEAGAWAIHPAQDAVDEHLVSLAHQHNLKVNTWMINSKTLYKKFSEMGVDNVFSDNPTFLC